MKIKRIQGWRRIAESLQAIIIIGLPFLKIKGESALRFDIPSLRLHFFGISLWMEEFFIVLIAVIFSTLLIVLITLMFGRIWCGWLCPQTVIVDFTRFVDRVKKKGDRILVIAITLLPSILIAANLIWYFVSPYEFFDRLFSWSLGKTIWGFWIVLTSILFLNFAFIRHRFCSTVCPYAKLQSALYDSKTLVIAFDPEMREECINCMACVRTCPVGIDIRHGLNQACINCAECIDECTKIMEKRNKKGLIGYFFGLPGETGKILRLNTVMIGSITALFFVFLLYLLFARSLVDMTVLPNYSFSPAITEKGEVINSYSLSLKNRGREGAELLISVTPVRKDLSNVVKGGEDIRITPDRIRLEAGELKNIPVYVALKSHESLKKKGDIEIFIEIQGINKDTVIKKANFIIPEV